EATTIEEVKDIHDKAKAVQIYYARKKGFLKLANAAALAVIQAERKIGELLADIPKGRPPQKRSPDVTILESPEKPGENQAPLEQLGISKMQAMRFRKLAQAPEEAVARAVAVCEQEQIPLTRELVLKLAKPSANGNTQKPTQKTDNGTDTDEIDQTIPPGLQPIFKAGSRELLNAMTQIGKQVRELAESNAGTRLRGPTLQRFEIDFKNARQTVRFAAPYAVCPVCRGNAKERRGTCHCKNTGWVTKLEYDQLPLEYRQ